MFTTPRALREDAADRRERERRREEEHRGEERRPAKTLSRFVVARARRERAEPDPERRRAPTAPHAEPPLAARHGPDARRDAEDPEQDRPDGRARGRPAGARGRTRAAPSSDPGHADGASPARQPVERCPARTDAGARRSRRCLGGRGRASARASADVPDGEDQHVGADEEHDRRLDHQRQVAGELGREDLGVEAARRRPVEERAEQERREADADRRVAAEQRDRDPDEADLRGLDVERAEPVLLAEHVERAGEAGERARDRHREEVAPRDVDPRRSAPPRGCSRRRAPRSRASSG